MHTVAAMLLLALACQLGGQRPSELVHNPTGDPAHDAATWEAMTTLSSLSTDIGPIPNYPVVQNLPMEPETRYEIAPGLTVELSESGTKEVFRGSNGLLAIGHADLVGEYTVEVIDPGSFVYRPRTKAAFFDAYWVPTELPGGVDASAELDRIARSHKPYTPGTGGQGRAYVNVASVVLSAPLTDDNAGLWILRKKAVRTLREWVIEELETRPLSHVPLLHHGDAFSRKVVNLGTEREWNHQKRNVWGWNAWDSAHMHNTYAFTLAAYGDPLGHLFVHLIGRWAIPSAYPGVCTNWMTQPRGEGWHYQLAAWLKVLGHFESTEARARFSCGLTMDQVAERWLEVGQRDHWKRTGLGDLHNSPEAAGEIARGHLAFHRAIRLWGLQNIIQGPFPREIKAVARAMFDEETAYLLEVAIDTESGGMARVVGTWPFDDLAAAEAGARTITEAGRNRWEAYVRTMAIDDLPPAPFHGAREAPRIQDAEMFWAVYAQRFGWDDAVETWLGNRDKQRLAYDLAALARR